MKIRPNHRDSPFFHQLLFDVFFSLSVIGFLIFFSVSSYQLLLKKVIVLSHVLAVGDSGVAVMEDLALTGYWNDREVPQPEYGPSIDADFHDGVFDIGLQGHFVERYFDDDQAERILLRAVTPVEDKLGPLIWVAGGAKREDKDGAKDGNLDTKYILRDLK